MVDKPSNARVTARVRHVSDGLVKCPFEERGYHLRWAYMLPLLEK